MTDTVTVVTNPATNTVEIVSVGPQGPQGPQGVKGDVGDVNPEMITLRDAAAASAAAAAGSASSASTSATTATTQASSASGSASTATSQATTATNQATTATTKAGEASTSATNAAASASTASSSASTATTQATNATNSASSAAGSASTATAQATIATTKAAEADASATAAVGSASSASTSASTASTQATNAANSQSTATSAAATATTQATNASTSATTATTKANDAANSATLAQNAATTASTQANSAIVSATAAAASQSAAAVSASGAAAGAATSTAKASEAAGSAAAIQATFGNAEAVALQAQNAQAAASLAQGYAASASSVVQQDLSGVTAQALHRSPNAITAMTIYDTSKDSDGGAWTKKCQQTSWYNEALAGKWLGPQDTEFQARNAGATLGLELVTNGSFAAGSTGWTLNTGWSVANGVATKAAGTTDFARFTFSSALTVGKTYAVQFDVLGATAGTLSPRLGGGTVVNGSAYGGNGTFKTVLIAASGNDRIEFVPNSTFNGSIDNISVREVTAITTASNDYFQLTTDGKFYRLWRNLVSWSEDFTNAAWTKASGSITATNITDPLGGFTADEFTSSGVNGYVASGNITVTANTSYALSVWLKVASGTDTVGLSIANTGLGNIQTVNCNVTTSWQRFTVSGSMGANTSARVLIGGNTTIGAGEAVHLWGAQLELGSTATTYEAKGIEASTSEIFRGNKAEFPKLAAIVAEAGNVNIYDLTEPGRPMWMRFAYFSGNTIIGFNGLKSLAALNGVLLVGDATNDLYRIEFAKDAASRHSLNTISGLYKGLISQRHAALGWDTNSNVGNIAARAVNAVAMTVLPDAPIDPATGLRVPTIAVATGGGVSVIQDDGVVRNSSSTASFASIQITKDRLIAQRTGNAVNFAANPGALGASFAMQEINLATAIDFARGNSGKIVAKDTTTIARIPNSGVTSAIALLRDNDGARTRGLSAHIQSTFNTGWITGDIRRAYLSDVTAESISGSELVTNGDFSGGTTGWTGGSGATISIVSGGLLVDDPTSAGFANQAITTIANRYYKITAQFVAVTAAANPNLWVGTTNLTSNLLSAVLPIGATGTITGYFQATGTTSYLSIGYIGTGQNVTIDNISVREVVADRSYKAQGASINGTLTKAQLASGTSLVGYSGFSASNYLREPYSADLDFGTGEFTASAWVNVPVTIDPATRALGPELLADPSLDTPASWSLNTGVSMTGGQIIFSSVGSTLGAYSVANISSAGRVYAITIVVSAITAGQFRIRMASGALVLIPASAGTYTIYCTSDTGASGAFNLLASGTTSGVVDSITVKEVSNCFIFDRAFSSGPRLQLLATPAGYLSAVAFDGTTTRTVTTTAAYNTATWLKARVRYTTDGSLAITINGREVAVTRGTPLLTLNNSSAVLTIGNNFALDAPFPGSIALLKMGATVPTTEQAQFMFEQEKQLFRAGAQSVLPDSGSILDMAYDDATDRWVAVSGTNESYWTGLVRNSVTPVPAGTYTRIVANSGVELNSRITTNPGVDVSIPAYGLREELVRRSEAASRLGKELATYDYVGGFTGNITTGSTAIASVAGLTYPTSYIGARISGTGIPANTTIVAVSGTTIYISAAATATTSTLSITFLDFILPAGMEAKTVMSAGAVKQEGSTKDYTRLYDGFLETIRFAAAPGVTAWVQIQAQRISQ